MIIDDLNLNHLRIFQHVYRARSMTTAARELHLTQSGVSQHMKALEESLGLALFDRVKQRLVPTASAAVLFQASIAGLESIEHAVAGLRGDAGGLAGTVAVGMPIEFGNNIVLPRVSEFCARNPGVRFALRYGFATEMNEALLSGALDFAFVDAFSLDRRIHVEKVYDETLHLCVAAKLLKRHGTARNTREFFEKLEYVDYQAGEPVLRKWFDHHLGKSQGLRDMKLNVRATVMDVQGVARLIVTGLAAGVLPGHLAGQLESNARVKLHVFRGCGKPLKNAISVGYLEQRTFQPAARAALDFLVRHAE